MGARNSCNMNSDALVIAAEEAVENLIGGSDICNPDTYTEKNTTFKACRSAVEVFRKCSLPPSARLRELFQQLMTSSAVAAVATPTSIYPKTTKFSATEAGRFFELILAVLVEKAKKTSRGEFSSAELACCSRECIQATATSVSELPKCSECHDDFVLLCRRQRGMLINDYVWSILAGLHSFACHLQWILAPSVRLLQEQTQSEGPGDGE